MKSQSHVDEPGKEGEVDDSSSGCASGVQSADDRDHMGTLSPEQAMEELSSLFSMASGQLPAGTGELVSASLEENACEVPAYGLNVAIRGPLPKPGLIRQSMSCWMRAAA